MSDGKCVFNTEHLHSMAAAMLIRGAAWL